MLPDIGSKVRSIRRLVPWAALMFIGLGFRLGFIDIHVDQDIWTDHNPVLIGVGVLCIWLLVEIFAAGKNRQSKES